MSKKPENDSQGLEEIATTLGIPSGEAVASLSVDELSTSFGLTGDEEVDPHLEGTYRRGYHQACSAIATVMRNKEITADMLDAWVSGQGMTWRKETRLDRFIRPPEFL